MGKHNEGSAYLEIAHKAWGRNAFIRKARERNKNFTYGRQWDDLVRDSDGAIVSEFEKNTHDGKTPSTNNLIRQLVKSVVGRFRASMEDVPKDIADSLNANGCEELDSRMLEEFLISGCAFQRVDIGGSGKVTVRNVSPAMAFNGKVCDPRGKDCDLIGQLHDMSMGEILQRFSDGKREKAVEICRIFDSMSADQNGTGGFYCSNDDDKYRVVELWMKESREVYECHDRENGKFFIAEPDYASTLPGSVEKWWTLRSVWRCRWIAPNGTIISQYDSAIGHPFAFKYYPLVDGEVHSFVEDVIDQQKFVNRMITIIDHVMDSTAKGVLLYPCNMLPNGFTWSDLKKAWKTPNAVIPYENLQGAIGEKPEQLVVNGSNSGAYELLNLQMGLFEKISGVSAALQGQNVGGVNGARLYDSQVENATISLLDIFASFKSFLADRNDKIRNNLQYHPTAQETEK